MRAATAGPPQPLPLCRSDYIKGVCAVAARPRSAAGMASEMYKLITRQVEEPGDEFANSLRTQGGALSEVRGVICVLCRTRFL